MDVLELQVLADLRRRKFSIPEIRRLLTTLRDVFRIRLYEAIGEGGPLTLFISGDQLYARTRDGQLVLGRVIPASDAARWTEAQYRDAALETFRALAPLFRLR